nr:MAG TPA: hypothetical protein [Caudoviricetes sp.]
MNYGRSIRPYPFYFVKKLWRKWGWLKIAHFFIYDEYAG